MFLINSNDAGSVLKVIEDLDYMDNFNHLDLGEINSLTLTELAPESINWTLGEPLVFDESIGIVLLPYSIESLKWLKNNSSKLAEYGVKEAAIKAFCDSGIDQLFCLDTF